MKYFIDCTNIQELKQMYRKLCFKLHPDIAGAEKEEVGVFALQFNLIHRKGCFVLVR